MEQSLINGKGISRWPASMVTIVIWLLGLTFAAGVAYANFATKQYVDAKTESTLQRIEMKLDRIEDRINQHLDKGQ